jgi:hypothetical protein
MPDISTPNLDYGNMVQAWDINDALMGGTLYMRQLGEAYLPRWPKEDKETIKSASTWPRCCQPTKRRLTRMSGVFLLSLSSLVKTYRMRCENLRKMWIWKVPALMSGRSHSSGWRCSMASHALVDYPRVDAEQVKTKADEKATGARPVRHHAQSPPGDRLEIEDGRR